MQFQGERRYAKSPLALCALLGDARFLVKCIPEAAVSGTPTPDEARCSVKPNLSFARGALDVHVKVADRKPPDSLRFALTNKSIGGGADVEIAMRFAPDGDKTKVDWQADVRLSGLLKMVPAGLIRGAAQKVIDEIWTSIDRQMAGQVPG